MYSKKLVEEYSANRNFFTATDKEVFVTLQERTSIKGQNILDFGCGDGEYSLKFIDMGAKSVVGVDTSMDMIKLAKSKKIKRTKFIQSKEIIIPTKDNQFDIVFSNFVFHHIRKLNSALKELLRVMKKGGVLVATMSAYDFDEKYSDLKNTNIPIQLGSEKKHIIVHNLIKNADDIKNDLIKAGFEIQIFRKIKNVNASISKSYKHLDKVKKLTLLIVAVK